MEARVHLKPGIYLSNNTASHCVILPLNWSPWKSQIPYCDHCVDGHRTAGIKMDRNFVSLLYRLCCLAHRVGRGIALLFHDRGTRGGEWSAARPSCTLPPGKTRYPFYRKLGGPQGRSGRAENLAPPGFDPRIVQPVVSRYTHWATCC